MDLDSPLRHLPLATVWGANALARDFLCQRPELRTFYPFGPRLDDLPAALAARSAQAWRADRGDLSAALRAGNAPFGLTAAQEQSLATLARPEGLAVVTGQQPGLLGGPLYTLHKALTAIVAAQRLRAAGQDAAPVFWVASEDDDWEEVNAAWTVAPGGGAQRLRLAREHPHGQSVGEVAVSAEEFDGLLAQLAESLGDTPATRAVVESLQPLRAHRRWNDLFTAWLLAQLGAHGLLVIDPLWPAVRRLAAPVLERVLDDPLAPTRLAAAAGEGLAALGYQPPTHRAANRCGFYLYRDGRRRRLSYESGVFTADDGATLTVTDLRAELASRPQAFSWGLLLRPVVQDYLLPTAMFVVGPGEIAYAAQVAPVFDWLGVARPLLAPRRSLTLLTPAVGRALETYGLSVCDVQGDLDALVARVVKQAEGEATEALFEQARAAVAQALAPAAEHAAALDASLRGAAESTLNRWRGDLDKLHKQAQRAIRQRAEIHTRRLALAHAWLSPGGVLQERRLSLAAIQAAAGTDLTPRLLAAVAQLPWDAHGVLRIEP
jgi:bacillithiol biosynthesis cysteine-adding enzyme BshC